MHGEMYGYSFLKERVWYLAEWCKSLASTAGRPAMYLGRCDHAAYITPVLWHITVFEEEKELKWLSRCADLAQC